MKNKRENQKGFTLIELLIAMVLLAIALLATASMQGIAMNANHVANRVTVATNLAQMAADELMSRNKTDSTLNSSTAGKVSYGANVTIPSAGTFSTTYQTTYQPTVNGTQLMGITQIDVYVSYISAATGTTQAATVTAYKEVS